MPFSPYRAPATPSEKAKTSRSSEEAQLLPFYAFVWVASLARLITATVRSEAFGTELTLALVIVILLPILAWQGFCDIASSIAASRKNKDS